MDSQGLSTSGSSILDSIIFRIVEPTNESISAIDQISHFRGQVIYENGLRPSFRLADGSYHDNCPFDQSSYHILAYSDNQLVGCLRLYLLALDRIGYCEKFIGRDKIDKIIYNLGVSYHEVAEVSRWVVQFEFRGNNLGKFLMAGIVLLASKLEQKILLAMSGTVREQDKALIRMGFQPVSNIPLYPEAVLIDELRLIYLDLRDLEKIPLISKVVQISSLLIFP
jgi:predicted GNAT family N-acyltransferase